MVRLLLIFILTFMSLHIFAQGDCADVDMKSIGEVFSKAKGGCLIIQTIPSDVALEIPKLNIDETKKRDSLIFDEVGEGLYELAFSSKQSRFICSVTIPEDKTVHLFVDVDKKTFKTEIVNSEPLSEKKNEEDQLYVMVEDMPEFPGGVEGIKNWVSSNLKYPTIALRNKVEGRVYISFVIDKSGQVNDVKVLRSVNPVFNEEAIRIVASMPAWKPGLQEGKPVRVSYVFPVNFQLPEKKIAKNYKTRGES